MRGFIKFLFAATIGALYGMLFAQKPGKKLRSDLKKSDNIWKTLFEEGKKVDLEARDVILDWAKNSKELQTVISTGKDQFDNFVENAKELGLEGKELAQEKLEEVAQNAKEAAEKLKKEATKKIKTVRKQATTKMKKLGKK